MSKEQPLYQKPKERRVRVERLTDESVDNNPVVNEFSSRIGRAINGIGNTRSLGSMSLSLLSAEQFSAVRNRLSSTDRNRLNARFNDFCFGLEEMREGKFSSHQRIAIAGLALWGRNMNKRRQGGMVKLAFNVVPRECPELAADIDHVKTYFSDEKLPEPNIDINKMHIVFGEVYWERLARGQNKMDPHTLVPAGLLVPKFIEMADVLVSEVP